MSELEALDSAAAVAPLLQGCGTALRASREQAGITLAQAAGEVKMPVRVLHAIEQESWAELGAPVFLRGQLRSYARFLKVDLAPYLQHSSLDRVAPQELVSRAHTPRYQRLLESLARRAVYVVLTAAIAVPVWVATQWDMEELSPQRTASLEVVTPGAGSGSLVPAVQSDASSGEQASPVLASLSALPRGATSGLRVRTSADSWIEVEGHAGASLDKGLLKAGEERSYRKGEVRRVVLGNAAAVEVQHAGRTVDLTPYQRANVVRFTVSSDGSLVPMTH